MSRPAFTKRPAPELGPDVIRCVVDCRHGTTIGDVIPGGRYVPTDDEVLIPGGRYVPTDDEVLAYLVERHEREERCGCARKLRRRSGYVIGRDE